MVGATTAKKSAASGRAKRVRSGRQTKGRIAFRIAECNLFVFAVIFNVEDCGVERVGCTC
jgi:hypothetical protein